MTPNRLVKWWHLKPLGNPPPNSIKFFAALEVLELVKDRNWLAKVTNAINQHWQRKNEAKKSNQGDSHVHGDLIR